MHKSVALKRPALVPIHTSRIRAVPKRKKKEKNLRAPQMLVLRVCLMAKRNKSSTGRVNDKTLNVNFACVVYAPFALGRRRPVVS